MNETPKIQVLRGHDSQETAYRVDDYPYGFRLRCKIRYWLEGKHGHGTRLVSQTTNPKVSGEVWNKPKASTYAPGLVVMYLNEEGHLTWDSCNHYYGIEKFDQFRTKFDLNEEELKTLDVLEKISRRLNPASWVLYDAKKAHATAGKGGAQ